MFLLGEGRGSSKSEKKDLLNPWAARFLVHFLVFFWGVFGPSEKKRKKNSHPPPPDAGPIPPGLFGFGSSRLSFDLEESQPGRFKAKPLGGSEREADPGGAGGGGEGLGRAALRGICFWFPENKNRKPPCVFRDFLVGSYQWKSPQI